MRRHLAWAWLALLLAAGSAQAHWIPAQDGSPTQRCLLAARAAGVLADIPDGLMERIAQVESGRPEPYDGVWRPWPWSINADGLGYVFESEAAAVAWAAGAPRRGVKLLDAGCLQVNLQYHPHAFATLEDAFDPWSNAQYAAHYLRSLYDDESGRDWSVAVGLYHSHTPELAEEYRTRVASLGQGIIQGLPPGPIAARLAALGTMRLQLVGGGTLRLRINRQPSMPGHRRPTQCQIAAALGPFMAAPPRLVGCPQTARAR